MGAVLPSRVQLASCKWNSSDSPLFLRVIRYPSSSVDTLWFAGLNPSYRQRTQGRETVLVSPSLSTYGTELMCKHGPTPSFQLLCAQAAVERGDRLVSSGTWRPAPPLPIPHLERLKPAQLGQVPLGCFFCFLACSRRLSGYQGSVVARVSVILDARIVAFLMTGRYRWGENTQPESQPFLLIKI